MDETTRSQWFLRVGGRVVEAELNATPEQVAGYLRANAFRKIANGRPVTPDERAALEATKGQPLAGTPLAEYAPDGTMGFVFHEAPHLVRQLDAIASELAQILGLGPRSEERAWWAVWAYAQRAERNAKEEADFFDFGDGRGLSHLQQPPGGPKLVDLKTGKAVLGSEAAKAEWMASPVGQATMAPDGGPDGWSTVPPQNSLHELHPDNLPPEGAA